MSGDSTPSDLREWMRDVARRIEMLERRRVGLGGSGSGGGVTDHGALTGLGDDDHPHYLTAARGNALYLSPAEVVAGANVTVDRTTTPGSVIISSSGGGGGTFTEVEVQVGGSMPTDPGNDLWVDTSVPDITPPEGGDKHYQHTQTVLESVWVVTHSLGKYPSVTVTDAAGAVVFGSVRHINDNVLTVTFGTTVTGTVYCN